ncbi:MAG: OmpA family protein, partial [Myxococcales bacterium]|nr:OmpA family protein [Myxococcales bacterium]
QDEDGCPDPDNDGDGIADAQDKCPNEAESQNGVEDEDGCPEADSDNDGLVDPRDQCPQQAEDKDGFEDEDGCPDEDNDKDGVADAADKCPMQPETANGYLDEDGCPDEIPIKLKQFTGTIEGIQFETGSDRIKKQSLGKLRKAVGVLQEFGDLKVIIEGHTDNVGKDDFNQELSQKRAESVRTYLIDQGIDAGRLTAQGFGPSRPVADNDTKEGRAKNRRVEFRLTK